MVVVEAGEGLRRVFERAGPRHHIGLFYSDQRTALMAAREYAIAGLRQKDFVCLVAPAEEVDSWGSLTFDIDERIRAGEYPEGLGSLYYPRSEIASEDGRVRLNLFLEKVARLAEVHGAKHLRVFGRLVAPFWENDGDGLIGSPADAERTVEDLESEISLFCMYNLHGLSARHGPAAVRAVKACHGTVLTQVGPHEIIAEPAA